MGLKAQAGPCQHCSPRHTQEAGQWTKVSQKDPGCPLSKLSPESCLLHPPSAFPRVPEHHHVRQHEGARETEGIAGTITPPSFLVIPQLTPAGHHWQREF